MAAQTSKSMLTKAQQKEIIEMNAKAQYKEQIGSMHLVISKGGCKICGNNDIKVPKYAIGFYTRYGYAKLYICCEHFQQKLVQNVGYMIDKMLQDA